MRNSKLRAFPLKHTKRGFPPSWSLLLKINRDIFRLQRIVHHIRQRSSAIASKRAFCSKRMSTSIVVHACYHRRRWMHVNAYARRMQSRKCRVAFRERKRERGNTYRMRGCDGLDFATVTHTALRKGNVWHECEEKEMSVNARTCLFTRASARVLSLSPPILAHSFTGILIICTVK